MRVTLYQSAFFSDTYRTSTVFPYFSIKVMSGLSLVYGMYISSVCDNSLSIAEHVRLLL